MKINIVKPQQVEAKDIRIYIKVTDRFTAHIHAPDGTVLGGQSDGYVPDFMPGPHYGDYLILNIDLESGQVTNWEKPSPEKIEEFIHQNKEN